MAIKDGYTTLLVRPMLLFFIVALIASAMFVIASEWRFRRSTVATKLGSMSDRWLAEYRASYAS
jgi:hypothetical protein